MKRINYKDVLMEKFEQGDYLRKRVSADIKRVREEIDALEKFKKLGNKFMQLECKEALEIKELLSGKMSGIDEKIEGREKRRSDLYERDIQYQLQKRVENFNNTIYNTFAEVFFEEFKKVFAIHNDMDYYNIDLVNQVGILKQKQDYIKLTHLGAGRRNNNIEFHTLYDDNQNEILDIIKSNPGKCIIVPTIMVQKYSFKGDNKERVNLKSRVTIRPQLADTYLAEIVAGNPSKLNQFNFHADYVKLLYNEEKCGVRFGIENSICEFPTLDSWAGLWEIEKEKVENALAGTVLHLVINNLNNDVNLGNKGYTEKAKAMIANGVNKLSKKVQEIENIKKEERDEAREYYLSQERT